MVGDNQFEAELFAERGAKKKVKIAEPGFAAGFVKRGGERDGDVMVRVGNAFQLPGFRAHQAMRRGARIFGARGKPREAHRNSTSNRGAVLPLRFRTDV